MKKTQRLLILLLAALLMLAACSKPAGNGNAGQEDAGNAGQEDVTENEAGPTAPVDAKDAAELIGMLSSRVTADNASEYDFTDQAMVYLEYLGTHLRNRSYGEAAIESNRPDEENAHETAQEWIVSELKQAGYTDDQIQLEPFSVNWGPADVLEGRNIILTVEGEDPSRQIIVGAHYDGDGVGDNGSGTALLLATAVGLHGTQPHFTVKYIFFDGEEFGMIGSGYNARNMTREEIDSTIYMINMDSLAFGDYCNIYGGTTGEFMEPLEPEDMTPPQATEAYDFAAATAEDLGFRVLRTADLDGYYAEHGTGPEITARTLYTNPWTPDNPAPANNYAMSPATIPASDHVYYMDNGIEYIYFEATNWFAESADGDIYGTSYTGYIETYNSSLGEHGMFMNTEYDTWENLNAYFPGRAEEHFHIFSPLLSALLLASPQ
ncbi:MAG: M28 family peptidase [Mogibacterium sp.]|nr:M28 family peptidase [Mogibacterium sp.]